MCVTANPATIHGTRTYVYATSLTPDWSQPVHVCGYQNEAQTLAGPNCMFLNFAGSNLQLVRGPELTRQFMQDMTARLPELVPVRRDRSATLGFFGGGDVTVESYGAYSVIRAQGPADMLSALEQVPSHRRPARTARLQEIIDFYMSYYSADSFVLACFDGKVKPQHPITVSYVPRDETVLTIPGLDGHDGRVPVVGAPVYRDFRVAFGIAGQQSPHAIWYSDPVAGKFWAPSSVAGFTDNRTDGPNGDYVVPIDAIMDGLTGRDLAARLR